MELQPPFHSALPERIAPKQELTGTRQSWATDGEPTRWKAAGVGEKRPPSPQMSGTRTLPPEQPTANLIIGDNSAVSLTSTASPRGQQAS